MSREADLFLFFFFFPKSSMLYRLFNEVNLFNASNCKTGSGIHLWKRDTQTRCLYFWRWKWRERVKHIKLCLTLFSSASWIRKKLRNNMIRRTPLAQPKLLRNSSSPAALHLYLSARALYLTSFPWLPHPDEFIGMQKESKSSSDSLGGWHTITIN